MDWIPLMCGVVGSALIGYLLWNSMKAANRREWNEAYYLLALAVMTLLIIR